MFLADIAAPVRQAMEDERRVARMTEAAARRRAAAYAALGEWLAGAEFRRLALHLAELAALRPWAAPADPDQAALLTGAIEDFASKLLSRKLKKMLERGRDIADLPVEALHALRKDGKRLRYACEFFLPLHPGRPGKRFVRRLTRLQDRLGALNDGKVAAGLLDALGGGADRAFASGAVQGFVAARSDDLRGRISRSWQRFRREPAFWE